MIEKCDMTALQGAYLKMSAPETYGINIPHEIAKKMERRRLIEWVPAKFGSTLYAITDAGRTALAPAQRGDE